MSIATVQVIRKIVLWLAVAAGIFFFAVSTSRYPVGGSLHEMVEWTGIVLIVACILGRTWASLYIGGRKIDQLVMVGPYSVTRNPLYFFSILGAIGVGMQIGSIVLGLICGALAAIVFTIVVMQEERLLAARYKKRYRDYLATVPRFVPDPRRWRDEKTLTIRPPRVLMTFADALVFLLSVPVAEGFEHLQELGVIPVLFHLW